MIFFYLISLIAAARNRKNAASSSIKKAQKVNAPAQARGNMTPAILGILKNANIELTANKARHYAVSEQPVVFFMINFNDRDLSQQKKFTKEECSSFRRFREINDPRTPSFLIKQNESRTVLCPLDVLEAIINYIKEDMPESDGILEKDPLEDIAMGDLLRTTDMDGLLKTTDTGDMMVPDEILRADDLLVTGSLLKTGQTSASFPECLPGTSKNSMEANLSLDFPLHEPLGNAAAGSLSTLKPKLTFQLLSDMLVFAGVYQLEGPGLEKLVYRLSAEIPSLLKLDGGRKDIHIVSGEKGSLDAPADMSVTEDSKKTSRAACLLLLNFLKKTDIPFDVSDDTLFVGARNPLEFGACHRHLLHEGFNSGNGGISERHGASFGLTQLETRGLFTNFHIMNVFGNEKYSISDRHILLNMLRLFPSASYSVEANCIRNDDLESPVKSYPRSYFFLKSMVHSNFTSLPSPDFELIYKNIGPAQFTGLASVNKYTSIFISDDETGESDTAQNVMESSDSTSSTGQNMPIPAFLKSIERINLSFSKEDELDLDYNFLLDVLRAIKPKSVAIEIEKDSVGEFENILNAIGNAKIHDFCITGDLNFTNPLVFEGLCFREISGLSFYDVLPGVFIGYMKVLNNLVRWDIERTCDRVKPEHPKLDHLKYYGHGYSKHVAKELISLSFRTLVIDFDVSDEQTRNNENFLLDADNYVFLKAALRNAEVKEVVLVIPGRTDRSALSLPSLAANPETAVVPTANDKIKTIENMVVYALATLGKRQTDMKVAIVDSVTSTRKILTFRSDIKPERVHDLKSRVYYNSKDQMERRFS